MQQNPEFIYFDLDNTLLHHSDAETKAQKEIYGTYPEFESVPETDWIATYKKVNRALWEQYQKGEIDREHLQHSRFHDSMDRLGLSTDRSKEIGESYMKAYRKYWRWVDGAEEAITKLSNRYPVGIVTNGFLETQQLKIEVMKLNRFTDTFVITEEIGVMKPHPRVFDHATDLAGVSRENILYVGDSYSSDIIGGRNAGWKTAWYTAFSKETTNGHIADFQFDRFPNLIHFVNGAQTD